MSFKPTVGVPPSGLETIWLFLIMPHEFWGRLGPCGVKIAAQIELVSPRLARIVARIEVVSPRSARNVAEACEDCGPACEDGINRINEIDGS
ncbi:hypothetical protein L3X38_037674 [Prunus dulcis]|uniref:Uncharacterized protein n=1 Tax=Prunus dulcis TaxID=3755 RepID=A0AAD4V5H2_PRUDU|nr:hypothetical protein L3X38_037674 [Prunus dulcis]